MRRRLYLSFFALFLLLLSGLEDFLYHRDDFYDTNHHLLSELARNNTAIWLRDLRSQMERDGLWRAL